MQKQSSKKSTPKKGDLASKQPSKVSRTSPEHYLASRLERDRSPRYEDPFKDGPKAMARYLAALSNFFLEEGSDADPLMQLFTGNISIKVSHDLSGAIEFDRSAGKATILLPKLPNQTAEQESRRIEALMTNILQSMPSAMFNYLTEILRGLPQDGRARLLNDYSNRIERK